jgi:hypothetical protein
MSANDRNDQEKLDREERINELKRQAEELTGGEVASWESDECPPDLAEEFWQQVVAYEAAPWTTHFQQLEEAGVELPAPETMDDQTLTAKLWEAIERLAQMRVFLSQTDHLSDRELYTDLWSEVLREETKAMSYDEYSAWHIDLLGSGSEEDTYLYMKYYADEESRQRWLDSFPDYEMPEHEDPPYDRDRHLPQATYGSLSESEFDESE